MSNNWNTTGSIIGKRSRQCHRNQEERIVIGSQRASGTTCTKPVENLNRKKSPIPSCTLHLREIRLVSRLPRWSAAAIDYGWPPPCWCMGGSSSVPIRVYYAKRSTISDSNKTWPSYTRWKNAWENHSQGKIFSRPAIPIATIIVVLQYVHSTGSLHRCSQKARIVYVWFFFFQIFFALFIFLSIPFRTAIVLRENADDNIASCYPTTDWIRIPFVFSCSFFFFHILALHGPMHFK